MSAYLDRKLRTPDAAQRDRLAVGDRVHHEHFGDGAIVDIFASFAPSGVSRERWSALVAFGDGHHAVDLPSLVKSELRVR